MYGIHLTSDGTIADVRGRWEGHHYIVEEIKWAKDITDWVFILTILQLFLIFLFMSTCVSMLQPIHG